MLVKYFKTEVQKWWNLEWLSSLENVKRTGISGKSTVFFGKVAGKIQNVLIITINKLINLLVILASYDFGGFSLW